MWTHTLHPCSPGRNTGQRSLVCGESLWAQEERKGVLSAPGALARPSSEMCGHCREGRGGKTSPWNSVTRETSSSPGPGPTDAGWTHRQQEKGKPLPERATWRGSQNIAHHHVRPACGDSQAEDAHGDMRQEVEHHPTSLTPSKGERVTSQERSPTDSTCLRTWDPTRATDQAKPGRLRPPGTCWRLAVHPGTTGQLVRILLVKDGGLLAVSSRGVPWGLSCQGSNPMRGAAQSHHLPTPPTTTPSQRDQSPHRQWDRDTTCLPASMGKGHKQVLWSLDTKGHWKQPRKRGTNRGSSCSMAGMQP